MLSVNRVPCKVDMYWKIGQKQYQWQDMIVLLMAIDKAATAVGCLSLLPVLNV